LHSKAPPSASIHLSDRLPIKTKGHFPNEEAARKLIYPAITDAVPAWARTRNWTTALLAFKIHFGDRLPE
jgi:transposase-like protein